MAKIVKTKVTGLLGYVLIEHEAGVDVVSEDGSYERYPVTDLDWVGETDDIAFPPSLSSTTQQEVVAAALSALGKFKRGAKA